MVEHLLIESESNELLKGFRISKHFRVHSAHELHTVIVIVLLFFAREVFLDNNVLI